MFMLIKGSCKFRSGKVCPVKSVKTWLLMPWHKAFCSASIKEVLKGRKITNVLLKTMVSITLIQILLQKSLLVVFFLFFSCNKDNTWSLLVWECYSTQEQVLTNALNSQFCFSTFVWNFWLLETKIQLVPYILKWICPLTYFDQEVN